MKIRLQGTAEECSAVVEHLRSRWQVIDVSRPYPPGDRHPAVIVRVYVTTGAPLALPGGEQG